MRSKKTNLQSSEGINLALDTEMDQNPVTSGRRFHSKSWLVWGRVAEHPDTSEQLRNAISEAMEKR